MPAVIRTPLQAILGLIVLGAAWAIAAVVVPSPMFLPSLPAAVARLRDLIGSGELQSHALASLTVLLAGLVPALIAGVLLGLVAAKTEEAGWLIRPLIVALAAVPVVVMLPMFVIWWGINEPAKIAFIFVATAFPVMNAIMVAPGRLEPVPEDQFPRREPKVVRGGAAAIVGGLRLGVALGVTWLLVSEIFASNRGLGFLIMNAQATFDMPTLMAGIIVVVVPTVLVVAFLQGIEEQIAD